ncbi:MAG: hypothetical protein ACRD6W_07510 [Nitrososphaerales archaeon]
MGEMKAVERAQAFELIEPCDEITEGDEEGRTVVSVGTFLAATSSSALEPANNAQSSVVHLQ